MLLFLQLSTEVTSIRRLLNAFTQGSPVLIGIVSGIFLDLISCGSQVPQCMSCGLLVVL